MLAIILTQDHPDPRVVLLVTTAAFFAAGLSRAPREGWLSSVLRVAAAGLLPTLLMQAHDSHSRDRQLFWWVICTAASAIFAAAVARILTMKGHFGPALAVGLVVCGGDVYSALVLLPSSIVHTAYRDVHLPVTPFHVQTFDGQRVDSQQWKGRVVVLAFWATWCGPCRVELPEIAAARARYRNNRDVLFLAVDPGWREDTESKAKAFITERHVVLDGAEDVPIPGAKSAGEAARSLSVQGLPVLFVIDRAGEVRFIHEGYLETEHLSQTLPTKIDALL